VCVFPPRRHLPPRCWAQVLQGSERSRTAESTADLRRRRGGAAQRAAAAAAAAGGGPEPEPELEALPMRHAAEEQEAGEAAAVAAVGGPPPDLPPSVANPYGLSSALLKAKLEFDQKRRAKLAMGKHSCRHQPRGGWSSCDGCGRRCGSWRWLNDAPCPPFTSHGASIRQPFGCDRRCGSLLAVAAAVLSKVAVFALLLAVLAQRTSLSGLRVGVCSVHSPRSHRLPC
jgi:hypothetical protein